MDAVFQNEQILSETNLCLRALVYPFYLSKKKKKSPLLIEPVFLIQTPST